MADVALVYPYSYTHASTAMLFHPLGIAQLSAQLRQEGIETMVMDLTFRDVEGVLGDLGHASPTVVGVYVMLTMVDAAIMLARKIRDRFPSMILACGGPMPTLTPERFSRDFDVVFRGEAAHSFPRFCEDLLKIGSLMRVLIEYGNYPGLYYREKHTGDVFHSMPQESTEKELNELPLPDRSDYDHGSYHRFWQERSGFRPAGIMTSFGCPHACDFCSKPVFGSSYRKISTVRLMEEVRNILHWGYDGLWIADDCFTLDHDHVRSFCHGLIREGLAVKWTCLSRTDRMPAELVALMARAGCTKVFFGLESGCNEVLRLMNKHTTVEDAEQTLSIFSRSDIETAGFFMVGYPGETRETIETTLAWALTLPLNELSFTVPFPLPGTKLFEKVHGLRQDIEWRYENENRLVFQSEFDEGYLRRRIDETMARFYAQRARHSGEEPA